MNQMMNYATGGMTAGTAMLPLVWVLTLILLIVLIRNNTKIRQRCDLQAAQGFRPRKLRARSTES